MTKMKTPVTNPFEFEATVPTYLSDGYRCKTRTAMVRHVVEQIRGGKEHAFIFIKGCTGRQHEARAKALCKAFLEAGVPAGFHGDWNVTVQTGPSHRGMSLLQSRTGSRGMSRTRTSLLRDAIEAFNLTVTG